MLKLGTYGIGGMHIGSDEIAKAYIGSDLVYSSVQEPSNIAFRKNFDDYSTAFLNAAYNAGLCASPNYMTTDECNAITSFSSSLEDTIKTFSSSKILAFWQFFPNLATLTNRIGGTAYKSNMLIVMPPSWAKTSQAFYRMGETPYNVNESIHNKIVFPSLTPISLKGTFIANAWNCGLYFPDDKYNEWCTAAASTAFNTKDKKVIFHKISELSDADKAYIKITIQ